MSSNGDIDYIKTYCIDTVFLYNKLTEQMFDNLVSKGIQIFVLRAEDTLKPSNQFFFGSFDNYQNINIVVTSENYFVEVYIVEESTKEHVRIRCLVQPKQMEECIEIFMCSSAFYNGLLKNKYELAKAAIIYRLLGDK